MSAIKAKVTASAFLEAVKYRRSVNTLTNKSPISDKRIQEIISEVLLNVPSSWNVQSTRALVVLGSQHRKLWDLAIDTARPVILKTKTEADWARNEARFRSFRAGYGTVVFFEDSAAVKAQQERFPNLPAEAFTQFSEHTSAMHQITAWTALELEGFGASLQHSHYVPGVESAIKQTFGLPETWTQEAALVFGGMAEEMPPKPGKLPVEETIKVFKDTTAEINGVPRSS